MASIIKKYRKEMILKEINIHSRVTFNELAQFMSVSEDTIRRDLNEMERDHQISKIRGGAMAKGNQYNSPDEGYAVGDKQIIAKKAVGLIKEGMMVLVGGGTTTRQLIKLIPDHLKATFVTGNPLTCIELLQKPNIETILLGGKVSGYSQSVSSGEALQMLADINADLCIMGTNAIDLTGGLTDSEWEAVGLKKAMFKAAKKVIILAISEKLNTKKKLRVSTIQEIDYLVTELAKGDQVLLPYREAGLNVI